MIDIHIVSNEMNVNNPDDWSDLGPCLPAAAVTTTEIGFVFGASTSDAANSIAERRR
jgi:hypothetical protein